MSYLLLTLSIVAAHAKDESSRLPNVQVCTMEEQKTDHRSIDSISPKGHCGIFY
jgi:hypothetical protein